MASPTWVTGNVERDANARWISHPSDLIEAEPGCGAYTERRLANSGASLRRGVERFQPTEALPPVNERPMAPWLKPRDRVQADAQVRDAWDDLNWHGCQDREFEERRLVAPPRERIRCPEGYAADLAAWVRRSRTHFVVAGPSLRSEVLASPVFVEALKEASGLRLCFVSGPRTTDMERLADFFGALESMSDSLAEVILCPAEYLPQVDYVLMDDKHAALVVWRGPTELEFLRVEARRDVDRVHRLNEVYRTFAAFPGGPSEYTLIAGHDAPSAPASRDAEAILQSLDALYVRFEQWVHEVLEMEQRRLGELGPAVDRSREEIDNIPPLP